MQVELMQGKSVGLGNGGYLERLLTLAFKGYSPLFNYEDGVGESTPLHIFILRVLAIDNKKQI